MAGVGGIHRRGDHIVGGGHFTSRRGLPAVGRYGKERLRVGGRLLFLDGNGGIDGSRIPWIRFLRLAIEREG